VKLTTVEYDLKVSASIGVSICPDDGVDLEILYKKAYEIMHESKRMNKD
jgi:GGDEF domain-containing protein